jgi:hypothetical protein
MGAIPHCGGQEQFRGGIRPNQRHISVVVYKWRTINSTAQGQDAQNLPWRRQSYEQRNGNAVLGPRGVGGDIMAEITEYLPVISKLLEKSKSRKIEWKGTYDSMTFICALEGEYSFEIEKGKSSNGNWYRKLIMKDREQGEVFVARAAFPTANSTNENDQLFQTLDELYEQARRTALDVDKKVNEISNILDKI